MGEKETIPLLPEERKRLPEDKRFSHIVIVT